jgi:ketosteroid isomerase-like protein
VYGRRRSVRVPAAVKDSQEVRSAAGRFVRAVLLIDCGLTRRVAVEPVGDSKGELVMRLLCCCVLLLTLVSPASAQDADPNLIAAFKEFVAATKGADTATVAAHYADDAVIFDQTGVHKGRAAVMAYFRPEALKSFAAMSTTLVDARSSGELGYTFATFAYPATGSQKPRAGNFLLVWRRIGARWRIVYDTFSSEPSANPVK